MRKHRMRGVCGAADRRAKRMPEPLPIARRFGNQAGGRDQSRTVRPTQNPDPGPWPGFSVVLKRRAGVAGSFFGRKQETSMLTRHVVAIAVATAFATPA